MLGCKKSLNSYSTDVMLTTRSITIVKTPAQKSCFAENFHKRKRKSLKPVFYDVFFVYCSTNVMKNKGIKAHKLRKKAKAFHLPYKSKSQKFILSAFELKSLF